ncbi:MAG: hypothetical protein NC416_19835 [Eubacterium sp.]|nr:hypothetical protein [Eubacterium sp.]
MLKRDKILQFSHRRAEQLFYGSLAVLSLFAFLWVGESGYVLFEDSSSYMNIKVNMEGVMPVYPLFLYANRLLFGENSYLYAVVGEQAVLAGISVIIFIRMIKNRFALKYWEAYICYGLALLPFTTDMPQMMTTHEILTEGIAYAVFYLFFAALLCAIWDKEFKWFGVSCILTLLLALIRSQLQILFGVCGVVWIYIVVMRRKNNRIKQYLLRMLCGIAGCVLIAVAGMGCTGKISGQFQAFRVRAEEEQRQQKMKARKTEQKRPSPSFTTNQYVTLIFSKGMYEADYEDYQLFEEEQIKDLYLDLYQRIDEAQYRYSYANPGLWMWRDIVGGVGMIGKECFYAQNEYYLERYPDTAYSEEYSSIRNRNQLKMGLTLIGAHFGRFLYHTVMLLPQAFVCTVFFQIEKIYLLCHLVTLFLYLSALILMIWAYRDKKAENAYGEFMCSVLGTNLVMIMIISIVFFGQQRYLVYNFGIFYIAYFLLFMQLWRLHGQKLVKAVRRQLRSHGAKKE